MKKEWTTPELLIEIFAPNHRIALNCRTNVNGYTRTDDVTWKCSRADGTSDDEGAHNDLLDEMNALDIFYSELAGCTTCVSSMSEVGDILTSEGLSKWGFSYSALKKGSVKKDGQFLCKDQNGEHTLFVNEFNVYDEIINS